MNRKCSKGLHQYEPDNGCPECAKIKQITWTKANPGIKNASAAKRRTAKLQRTPKYADLKAIKQFYINCPDGYEVDHIIPLQGKNVSGFHILENLQYLTEFENRSKGNKCHYQQ